MITFKKTFDFYATDNELGNYISSMLEVVEGDIDTQIDFDSEMKFFQNKFREIIRDEKNSQNELIKAFKELGYNIDE